VAEPPFVGTSQSGVRGDVIHQVDWQVGEIMKTLDRLDLAKNTIIIFSSDNGPILFDGYYDRSVEDLNGHQPAGGLRGSKYLVFEGGCRVPFIARWPGQIKPRVSDQMISLVDCYATLAKIVGKDFPASVAPDSLDLSAVLLGTTKKNLRDHTVLHGIGGLALRKGDWKYIPASAGAGGMGSGANAEDERFAAATIPNPMLFNLAADPNEKENIIEKNPEKAAELAKELETIKSSPTVPSESKS
jgi:arylsulfatase A-like enzyme